MLACIHALTALDICVSDAIQKKHVGALWEKCSLWNTLGKVFCIMVELHRFDTKSKKKCSDGNTFSKVFPREHFFSCENGPFLVSFPVITMTLCKNRYQTGTMSLTVCLDTRKDQQNNILQLPAELFTPLSSSTTMTDNYNTNVTMVYDDKSIDLYKPNKELLNFADIARNIQNWASCCIGLDLKEARLFREFFGTSVRVVKILWALGVCCLGQAQAKGGAPGASALGALFHEGVPQAEPGLLGHRRVYQRRRPKDPPQMGLGIR
jgi:hypothetical protein